MVKGHRYLISFIKLELMKKYNLSNDKAILWIKNSPLIGLLESNGLDAYYDTIDTWINKIYKCNNIY